MNWKRFTEILKDQFRRERAKQTPPHLAGEFSGKLLAQGGVVKNRSGATGGFFFSQDEIFNRSNPPVVPASFLVGQVVWAATKTYGRILVRIDNSLTLGDHWFYEVSEDGLRVSYAPRKVGRRLIVPEESLEHHRALPAAPTGSAEAAAAAFSGRPWDSWSVEHPIGGLWGFTSPPSSLEDLKAWAEEHGKEWASPAAQTQYMMEHFERTGEMAIHLPVVKDQESGLAHSTKNQLEPLHREFLLTIDHLINVIGDVRFAEKMRLDLMDLWGEEKVAKGVLANEVLGMGIAEYAHWLVNNSKESSQ